MTRQIPVSAHPFQLGAPLVALEGDTACQKTEAPTSMAKSGALPQSAQLLKRGVNWTLELRPASCEHNAQRIRDRTDNLNLSRLGFAIVQHRHATGID